MSKLMLISADCHAGAQPETYREYLPAKLRPAADAWWQELEAEMTRRRGTFFDPDSQDDYDKSKSVLAGGTAGEWDPAILLNQDGVYATQILVTAQKVAFVDGAWGYYRSGLAGSERVRPR